MLDASTSNQIYESQKGNSPVYSSKHISALKPALPLCHPRRVLLLSKKKCFCHQSAQAAKVDSRTLHNQRHLEIEA
jgi:hypothetical protein